MTYFDTVVIGRRGDEGPLGSGRLVHDAPSKGNLEPLRDFGVETWAQALLKFVPSDERATCAIPATSDPPFFGNEEREYVSHLAQRR